MEVDENKIVTDAGIIGTILGAFWYGFQKIRGLRITQAQDPSKSPPVEETFAKLVASFEKHVEDDRKTADVLVQVGTELAAVHSAFTTFTDGLATWRDEVNDRFLTLERRNTQQTARNQADDARRNHDS